MGVTGGRIQQLEIHERRVARGWSCQRLAAEAGLPRKLVCEVTCGGDNPPASSFVAVIRALDPEGKPEGYIRP